MDTMTGLYDMTSSISVLDGYKIEELAYISALFVIALQAGERIVLAPVMGLFGGVAVICVLAMGRELKIGRTKTNLLGYKAEMQRWGTVDAFLDISPPGAAGSRS